MKRATVICFILTVIFVLAGCCGPQRINTSRTHKFSASPPDVIRAVSFNIRVDTILDGPNRWECLKQHVFDVLADHAADVIGLKRVPKSIIY